MNKPKCTWFMREARRRRLEKRRRVHLICKKIVEAGRKPFGANSGIGWV